MAFEPPPLQWAREALGLEAPHSKYNAFTAGDLLEAMEGHLERAPEVAAALVVYVLGYHESRNGLGPALEEVAAQLGLAGESKPTRAKRRARKGAAPDAEVA